jgi:hypothetical protein
VLNVKHLTNKSKSKDTKVGAVEQPPILEPPTVGAVEEPPILEPPTAGVSLKPERVSF